MDENPIREFVLFVARACERAITMMRDNGFSFERFPRDLAIAPPTTDAERWECLAFSLYTQLVEHASKADHLLEGGTVEHQAQRIADLQLRLDEERAIREWLRAELRGTRERLDDVNVKDSVKTREINILTDENRRLCGAIHALITALAEFISATEAADNPRDEGVSEHEPVVARAREAVARYRHLADLYNGAA